MALRRQEAQRPPRHNGPPLHVMQFWGAPPPAVPRPRRPGSRVPAGYKFETLATMPSTWDETSREYIEGRETHVVNNKEQYCSVVRTGIGKTILCLGGEVDASALPLVAPPLPPALLTTASSLGLEAAGARRAHQLGRA